MTASVGVDLPELLLQFIRIVFLSFWPIMLLCTARFSPTMKTYVLRLDKSISTANWEFGGDSSCINLVIHRCPFELSIFVYIGCQKYKLPFLNI